MEDHSSELGHTVVSTLHGEGAMVRFGCVSAKTW